MKPYLIPILVLILTLTSGILVGCGQSQPPYFKAPGEPVNLVNNSRAYDHPWQVVWGFLVQDATDKEAYTPEHMCGFFAEKLHNRAEYYSFKTAFVSVEFEDGEPHALNAFNTVDYGLVYIDCTGKGRFEAPAPGDTFAELAPVDYWDKVAYIVEGENMGLISLGYEEQDFSYKWYEECRARLADFERDLDKFNSDLNKYDSDLNSFDLEGGNDPDYRHWIASGKPSPALTKPSPPPPDRFFYISSGFDWELYEYWHNKLREYYAKPTPEEWERWLRLDEERQRLEKEGQRLEEERNRLIDEWETVREYDWEESDSPVTHIGVYW